MSWRTEWRDGLGKEFDPVSFKKVYNRIYQEEFGENVTAEGLKNALVMNREKAVLRGLAQFKWRNLLDVGCQNGRQLLQVDIAFPSEELVGIDISDVALKVAMKIVPSVKLIECTVEEMPFNDNQFDVVIMSETLEHFFDANIALKEAHRVLKPNGIMLGTVPIGRNYDGGGHLRYYDHSSLHKQLEQYFIVEELEEIGALYSADKPTVFYFKCKKF